MVTYKTHKILYNIYIQKNDRNINKPPTSLSLYQQQIKHQDG